MDRSNKVGTATREFALALFTARQQGKTWGDISLQHGVIPQTAKKILVRYGIEPNPNGKGRKPSAKWTRPCIRCGKPERRHRGLFLCKSCRKLNQRYDAPDIMYSGYNLALPDTPSLGNGDE